MLCTRNCAEGAVIRVGDALELAVLGGTCAVNSISYSGCIVPIMATNGQPTDLSIHEEYGHLFIPYLRSIVLMIHIQTIF